VADLERRLAALHYWVGTVDDVYDDDTAHAVTAFEKVAGLERDGVAGPQVLGALATSVAPASRSSDGDLVEVDIGHQILIAVRDGRTELVFDISTGTSSTPTATGRFEIDREVDGYDHSRLGVLYRPKYFNGGQAIHGFPSVPPYPASHGCVRLTNHAIDWVWSQNIAPIGTPVLVYP
jgi:peptidoglycan hydrolase-like protein with peptidoglycan-binding domain